MASNITITYLSVYAWTAVRFNLTATVMCGASLAQLPPSFALLDQVGNFWSAGASSVLRSSVSSPLVLTADAPTDLFGASSTANALRICQAIDNGTGALVANTQLCACRQQNRTASQLLGSIVNMQWAVYGPNRPEFAWTFLSALPAAATGVLPGVILSGASTSLLSASYFSTVFLFFSSCA